MANDLSGRTFSEIENNSSAEVEHIRDLLFKMMIKINLFYQDKNTVLNVEEKLKSDPFKTNLQIKSTSCDLADTLTHSSLYKKYEH